MKVKYIQHCGDDLTVVNAARVSFKKESDWERQHFDMISGEEDIELRVLSEKDEKLIHYLAKNQHFSPFNHTFITMHVKAPIFVARQLVKHSFMIWNEVSRRYVDEEPEFYVPEVWRERAENVKQGSGINEIIKVNFGEGYLEEHPSGITQGVCENLRRFYNDLLGSGICPEQARMVLPLNTYTEWYWSGTLGAWAKMYLLRSKPDTQLETQQIANQAGKILEGLFPVSWKALTQ